MHIPTDTEGWTVDVIRKLAMVPTSENRRFDFKSAAALGDPKATDSVSKGVASFANSDGGFLVFGVDQKPNGTGWVLKPMPPNTEVNQWFHQKVKVEPTVEYEDPYAVPDGERAYYVVHIPAGAYGPYASVARGVPAFYHRTTAGCEPMPYDMIRDRMVGIESRRVDVDILIHELDTAFQQGTMMQAKGAEQDFYALTPFDLQLIRETSARLHALIARDGDALESLAVAQRMMRRVNTKIELATRQVGSMGKSVYRVWEGHLAAERRPLLEALNRARLGVGRVFKRDVGNWARHI